MVQDGTHGRNTELAMKSRAPTGSEGPTAHVTDEGPPGCSCRAPHCHRGVTHRLSPLMNPAVLRKIQMFSPQLAPSTFLASPAPLPLAHPPPQLHALTHCPTVTGHCPAHPVSSALLNVSLLMLSDWSSALPLGPVTGCKAFVTRCHHCAFPCCLPPWRHTSVSEELCVLEPGRVRTC